MRSVPAAAVLLLLSTAALSQDADVKSTPLTQYQPNYFLFGHWEEDRSSWFKLQLSVKVSLSPGEVENDPGVVKAAKVSLRWLRPIVTFSLRSFWDIRADSSPFRQHNFTPAFWLEREFTVGMLGGRFHPLRRIGIVHQSTGVDGPESRGWNRLIYVVRYERDVPGGTIKVYPRAWWVVSEEDLDEDGGGNPDIGEYTGECFNDGDICIGGDIVAKFEDNRNWFELAFVHGEDMYEVDFFHKFPYLDIRVYHQFHYGRYEGLLQYDERTTSYGIGLALRKRDEI